MGDKFSDKLRYWGQIRMKKGMAGLKYWGQIFLLPIYWISFITPRKKNIWLFGSTFGRRFADNPKYLYLYISQHKREHIRPIWISKNKSVVQFLNDSGYEAYYYHSVKGIYYCFIGRVYIFDNYSKDISFWTSGGAIKVNLWHGVGNKRINFDNKFDKVRHPKNRRERFKTFLRRLSDEKPSHFILATSPLMAEIFARAFQVSLNHVLVAGYPRNDILLGAMIKNLYTSYEETARNALLEYKKEGMILDFYMPTFRKSEFIFMQIMDLEEFNQYLVEKNILFVTKLHPKSELQKMFRLFQYSNIFNLDAEADPYVFLGLADLLTTDYSSIYSDYMLLNRPVVAFQYDYDIYSKETREGYFEFDEYMPEVKAKTMIELMNATTDVLHKDRCEKLRSISKKRMFKSNTSDSCEILFNKIKNLCD